MIRKLFEAIGWITLVFFTAIFVVIVDSWKKDSAPQPVVQIPTLKTEGLLSLAENETGELTYKQFTSAFKGDFTEAQKNRIFDEYRGRKVTWTGEVYDIWEEWACVRMGNPIFYDTIVIFEDKDSLLKLNKGQKFTFEAEIFERGGVVMPLVLNHGRLK